jgi:hypothetical protein
MRRELAQNVYLMLGSAPFTHSPVAAGDQLRLVLSEVHQKPVTGIPQEPGERLF